LDADILYAILNFFYFSEKKVREYKIFFKTGIPGNPLTYEKNNDFQAGIMDGPVLSMMINK